MNRDAWDYLPARSVQHNSCWAGFHSILGTQSSACWGHNGPIKAPSSALHQSVPPPAIRDGVSFLSPCSLLRVWGHCCRCWPLTCTAHSYVSEECENKSLDSVSSLILKCFGLWCKHVSHQITLPAVLWWWFMSVIVPLLLKKIHDLWELWGCGLPLQPVNFVSCTWLSLLHKHCWGVWSYLAPRSYLSAASLKRRSTGLRCNAGPSAHAVNTLVMGWYRRQEGSLFNLVICDTTGLLIHCVLHTNSC